MIKERIGEKYQVDCEVLSVTSGVGATSQFYSMENCSRALIVVSMATAAGNLQPIVSISQGAAATSTPAAITASSALLGSSNINRVDRGRQAIITITTATTDGETLIINGTTFTVSTAAAATALTYGATAGSTAAAGAATICASLSSLINTYCTNLLATTVTTATVRVKVKDNASTYLTIVSTGANQRPSYEMQQTMIEVLPSALDSTSRGIFVNVSTIATAVLVSMTIIRDSAFLPAPVRSAYLLTTAVSTA